MWVDAKQCVLDKHDLTQIANITNRQLTETEYKAIQSNKNDH